MAKKRTTSKKSTKAKAPSQKEINMQLIENFVKLQKVMANLTVKFDTLSDNMTKLLQIFEISAKSFIQKQEQPTEDSHMLVKLDTLLDQNKTIASGLTLIEEKMRHRLEHSTTPVSEMDRHHSEAELHGLYDIDKPRRPRPGTLPSF